MSRADWVSSQPLSHAKAEGSIQPGEKTFHPRRQQDCHFDILPVMSYVKNRIAASIVGVWRKRRSDIL